MEGIVQDFQHLSRFLRLFDLSDFLRFDSEPVVYIGASSCLEGCVKDFVRNLNSIRRSFLVGDHAHPWAATSAYTEPLVEVG